MLANTREKCIYIELYIYGGKDSDAQNRLIFDNIYKHKDKIESEVGELIWHNRDDACMKLVRYRIDKDPADDKESEEALPLVIEKLDQFISIFPKYWKNI